MLNFSFRNATATDLSLSPVEVARGLQHCASLVFFDSVGNFPKDYPNPVSVIAAFPSQVLRGSLWKKADYAELQSNLKQNENAQFSSPAMGWIDYAGAFCFGFFPRYLIFDHVALQWYDCGNLQGELKKENPAAVPDISVFESNFTREEYTDRVHAIQRYITAGDIYQVNLTQRFRAKVSGDSLFFLYELLRKKAPAPMASYLRLAGQEVLSSSPETFLRMEDRSIETRPIKGTRPRFADLEQDKQSALDLQQSEKEQAELIMITDLLRNDIGQVCEYGSVKVRELNQLESLRHVHHLVSLIEGKLRAGVSHAEALKACFPGGSITGAPKKRAMEIIEELETVPRGIYTGAVGYFGLEGKSQFNIVIRSLMRDGEELDYHVGAGIVADSDPTLEYEETLQKARGVRQAIAELKTENL